MLSTHCHCEWSIRTDALQCVSTIDKNRIAKWDHLATAGRPRR